MTKASLLVSSWFNTLLASVFFALAFYSYSGTFRFWLPLCVALAVEYAAAAAVSYVVAKTQFRDI